MKKNVKKKRTFKEYFIQNKEVFIVPFVVLLAILFIALQKAPIDEFYTSNCWEGKYKAPQEIQQIYKENYGTKIKYIQLTNIGFSSMYDETYCEAKVVYKKPIVTLATPKYSHNFTFYTAGFSKMIDKYGFNKTLGNYGIFP